MKLMTPHRIAIALLSSSALVGGAAHAESRTDGRPDQRIAVVAMQDVVARTEDGLRAQATLKKLFDNRQQELNAKQNELAKQKDELDKKGPSMKDFQKKAEEWQKEMVKLQSVFVEYNKELDQQRVKITEPIFDKVTKIVRQIAAERFDVILDKSAVVYVKPEFDLTEQAIQQYNAGSAPAAKSAAPAKKADSEPAGPPSPKK